MVELEQKYRENYGRPSLVYSKNMDQVFMIFIVIGFVLMVSLVSSEWILILIVIPFTLYMWMDVASIPYDKIVITNQKIVLFNKQEVYREYSLNPNGRITLKVTRHRSKNSVRYRLRILLHESSRGYADISFKYFLSSNRRSLFQEIDEIYEFLTQKCNQHVSVDKPFSLW
ncbi:hypothetical protein [Candidatus Lokiarchaeum ossiferum]|uniref:hypothetical protein n=1 Tax=Candidatus Lokiarchaeum ossiferum TaxID=2951803 RepID=UPI00352D0CB0